MRCFGGGVAREPALHEAAARDDVPQMRALLNQAGDATKLLASVNSRGETALHRAALGGLAAACELLLTSGAAVDARTPRGQTALILACCSSVRSAQQVVQLLLDARASASAASSRGLTALHAAAQFSNCAVVALLLQAGALPSALTREGESALALAQRRGDAEGEAVSALLSTVSDSSLRADAPVRRSLIHHGEPGGELPLGELHH